MSKLDISNLLKTVLVPVIDATVAGHPFLAFAWMIIRPLLLNATTLDAAHAQAVSVGMAKP